MSTGLDTYGLVALDPALPIHIFTRSGSRMAPREDVWKWTDGPFNARIDFRRYTNGYENFVPALKRCLIPFVKGYSCGYVQTLEIAFRHFVERLGDCPKGAIDISDISTYREKLPLDDRWRLGRPGRLWRRACGPGANRPGRRIHHGPGRAHHRRCDHGARAYDRRAHRGKPDRLDGEHHLLGLV